MFLQGRKLRTRRWLSMATGVAMLLQTLLVPAVAQAVTTSATVTASLAGGANTVVVGGVVYAKAGGSLTLTVNASGGARCVKVSGAFTAVKTTPFNTTNWSFGFTAGSGEGPQTVTVQAFNALPLSPCAALQGSTTATFTLDNTGPVVSANPARPPNAAGWYNADIGGTWTATDSGSGVDASAINPSPNTWLVTSEGTPASMAIAKDRLGNLAFGSVTVKLDKTAPTFPAVSAMTASNVTGSSLTLAWSAAADNLGLSHYQVYQNGAPLTTVPAGTTTLGVTGLAGATTYSFKVTAVDMADNASADGPAASARTSSTALIFVAPLSEWAPATQLAASAFAIQFKWMPGGVATSAPTAMIRIINAGTGNLVTSYVMKAGITYDASTGLYTQLFNPTKFHLPAGTQLTVQVYVARKLQSSSTIILQ